MTTAVVTRLSDRAYNMYLTLKAIQQYKGPFSSFLDDEEIPNIVKKLCFHYDYGNIDLKKFMDELDKHKILGDLNRRMPGMLEKVLSGDVKAMTQFRDSLAVRGL